MSFINPEETLNQLELNRNMIAADFGCGSGSWTIPLAQKLDQGKVYAIDIQEEPISALTGKAQLCGILNIEKVLADAETEIPKIKNFSCDLVLMTALLFQAEDKHGIFKQAMRVLKSEGRVLVVDWKIDVVLGPKYGKISASEVKQIAEDCGFKFDKEIRAGKYHYALVFIKA